MKVNQSPEELKSQFNLQRSGPPLRGAGAIHG